MVSLVIQFWAVCPLAYQKAKFSFGFQRQPKLMLSIIPASDELTTKRANILQEYPNLHWAFITHIEKFQTAVLKTLAKFPWSVWEPDSFYKTAKC